VKRKLAVSMFWVLVTGMTWASGATAQSIAYRQTNLASDVSDIANTVNPSLENPWGIAFLPGQPFFLANNRNGTVTALDAMGFPVAPGDIIVPNAAGSGPDAPTGIVADVNSEFAGRDLVQPFILVTANGNIFEWGRDAQGNFLLNATLVSDNSSTGAVYRGVAILHSPSSAPAVAVTDFHGGTIQAFLPGFAPVALAGPFTDPNLPAGYAPFGIQVIGQQVFVTYAVQDTAKHDPVAALGNGIVSIFDMDGNFVRRFATGGMLNAPWGVTQASADFGPFSNDILIGNAGDGIINAFDPDTGNFVGQITDGGGNVIRDLTLHALAFRSDGFGNPNTLYVAVGIGNGLFGVFGAITPGMVSTTGISVQTESIGMQKFTATVAASPGNTGIPTGTVAFTDGGNVLQTVTLVGGMATLSATLSARVPHTIDVNYSGDASFLPSHSETSVPAVAVATTLSLNAPATAVSGSQVNLVANISGSGGTFPTGQVLFLDGNSQLGTAPLNATGRASLTVTTLPIGNHALSASYVGDDTFSGSASSVVNVNVTAGDPDFAFVAAPPSATVPAGQSTQFMLTVTPSGGFASNVTFSCPMITGITCGFNPPTLTPTNGSASTTLTVTTSASVMRYAIPVPAQMGPGILPLALALAGIVLWHARKRRTTRAHLLTAGCAAAVLVCCLTLGGCGGYSSTSANRGTTSIVITARSGTLSHTATVSVTVQ